MLPLDISEYSPAHDDDLVRMWRASFEHGVGVTDPHPLHEQIAYLHEKVVPHHRVRLVWQGDVLVAFMAANHESIAQLFVRVGHHRQGIGSRLLALAKSESAGSLWLFTFQRNLFARRFYEHHGFEPVQFGVEPMWQLADVKYLWIRGESAT